MYLYCFYTYSCRYYYFRCFLKVIDTLDTYEKKLAQYSDTEKENREHINQRKLNKTYNYTYIVHILHITYIYHIPLMFN